MNLHSLSQQIDCRLITDLRSNWKKLPCSSNNSLLPFHQLSNHILCLRHALLLSDGGKLRELLVGAWCRKTKCTYTLGDLINRFRQFRILLFKHQVQGIEQRPCHVPMKVMSLYIKDVTICQQARNPICNFFTACI